MTRHLDQWAWLVLMALAVAFTVACSSSSSSGPDEPSETVSDAATQG